MYTSDLLFPAIFDTVVNDLEIAGGILKPDVKEALVSFITQTCRYLTIQLKFHGLQPIETSLRLTTDTEYQPRKYKVRGQS